MCTFPSLSPIPVLEVVIQFDQLDDKDKELLKKHSKDDLIIETNSKVEFK